MFRRAALPFAIVLLALLLGATPAPAEEGLTQAGLTPSRGQLTFGDVDMHFGGSPQQSVQFTSASPLPLLVSSAVITGADPASFQIINDGCSGSLLELAQSCSVEVAFHPTRGARSANLELLDGEGSVDVSLSGSGITGTPTADPSPLSFSPIPFTPPGHEGEYNETEQVNVLNSQDAGTQIESVSITGPDASSFSIQYGNCQGDLLAPGNSCDVGVRFAASTPGPKSASLVLTSDSSGTPLVVALEGEALHGPKVSMSSTQALLGDVPIGSSAQHTFTVSNSGDYPLFIQQAFLVSGTPLMFPVLSDTCSGQAVYPSASCALTVGFQPGALGEKSAAIIFITNASPINVVGVDGVGVRALAGMPALFAPLTPAAREAAPAGAAPSGQDATIPAASPHGLAVERAPRLYGSIGRAALDTGLLAQCPVAPLGCETVSFLTASIAPLSTRASARGVSSTPVLLGSALTRLHSGQSARVRIPLSRHAMTLLRRRGRLRVSIETIVRAAGKIVAENTRVATLVAPSGAPHSL